jgi:alpha-aminoadipate carrier protein LysW
MPAPAAKAGLEKLRKGVSSMAATAVFAPCPDCGEEIELWSQVKVGEELTCPYCEAELEVISLDPVELDWAYVPPAEDEEDWDEEEDQ